MINVPSVFKFRCPHCGQKHAVPEAFIGKVVRCQPCGNTIHVQSEPPRRPVDMPMVPRSREEVPQSEIDAGWGYIFPPSD